MQKDVFTLKQLESIAPKQKGISMPSTFIHFSVVQSVKDVLQNLVDDGIAKSEKLGTSNYFWCFPSDEIHSVFENPRLQTFSGN